MILICKYCEEEFTCVRNSLAHELEVCNNCYLLKHKGGR